MIIPPTAPAKAYYFRPTLKCLAPMLMLCSMAAVASAQGTVPVQGFRANQPYAGSGIDSVSMNNGNVMVRLPLASLPPGRGGLSAGIGLLYESKMWKTTSDVKNTIGPNGEPVSYDVKMLESDGGNWQYLYGYSIGQVRRSDGYPVDKAPKCPDSNAVFDVKLQVGFPDGSVHTFRPAGYNDLLNDGFYAVLPDGHQYTCGGVPMGFPAQLTFATSQKMVYYSTDGTYVRLEVEHDGDGDGFNNPWTLYFPDGGRVTGGNAPQRIYDRNNNYVEIQENTTYNSHRAVRIVDQFNREVILEYGSAPNQDSIHQWGINHEEIVWTVKWKDIDFTKHFLMSDDPGFPYPPQAINSGGRVIDQITLPAQAGSLAYTFRYNAASENPSAGGDGWGELSSITLPSGARTDYHYWLDGQDNVLAEDVVANGPTSKDVTYLQEYDGVATSVTETWHYGFGRPGAGGDVVGPDGGVTSEFFNDHSSNILAPENWDVGISLSTENPDGSKVERYWQPNTPYGSRPANPYVKTEYTSIKDAAGNYSKTAIKDFTYDKNGNILSVTDYDWVPYTSVQRDGRGLPTGAIPPPPVAQIKRVTNNTYYNSTPIASDTVTDSANTYHRVTSGRVRDALESTELGDSAQTLSRSEIYYDDPSTTANVAQRKNWDSYKGGVSRQLTRPLGYQGADNFISTSQQYDAYGNPTLSTDANGNQTQITYGQVGGITDLYPTKVESAYGTPIKRTFMSDYDFYTGAVVRTTDVDNGVSTSTTYDVFGRPTLIKASEGLSEETRTQIDYSDTERRVVMRKDLITVGDGRLVSVQHYDQLGRVRLSRTLEDSTAESETNEQAGIKVQTRYLYSGQNGYQLVSNPYRAATASAASGESTMGWTRTKSDNSGRVLEVEAFAGSGVPAPWGANTSSTGKMTTAYDAEFTTVTDQAQKIRRSVTNALRQLVRVDEPDGNNGLGNTASPAQPTYYAYDALGNLTQVNQGTQTRTFGYSSLSRLISAANPEACQQGQSQCVPVPVTYDYYADGSLQHKTDARGVTTTYAYDELSRVKTRSYSDSTPSVTYTYDASGSNSIGRLTSVVSSVSTTTYGAYDALGRVKQSSQTTGGVTYAFQDYSYDRAGNLISETYPSGRVVKSEYDTAGRLAGVKNQASGVYYAGGSASSVDPTYQNRLQYAAHGVPNATRLGNGLWEHTIYNSRLQPTQIGLGTTSGDGGKLQLDYSYGTTDNNGNVQSQTITGGGGMVLQQSYSYDQLNRLSSFSETGGGTSAREQVYAYDRFGNRTVSSAGGGAPIRQFDTGDFAATNRLYAPGDTALPMNQRHMRYDAAGNLTYDDYSDVKSAGGRNYDAENRMTSAWGGDPVSGTYQNSYAYDGDGRRVKSTTGSEGKMTVFVYDAMGRLVAEYSSVTAQQNGTQYLTQDSLGTPRAVTNAQGGVVSRHDYLPFGEEIGANVGGRSQAQGYVGNADGNRKRWAKLERDDETGLDYAEHRYYSSAAGRFTSIDPDNYQAMRDLSDPQSWNAYAYVNNNPLGRVDPDGRGWFSDLLEKINNKVNYGHWMTDHELSVEAAKAQQQIATEFVWRDANGVQHPFDTSHLNNGEVVQLRDKLVEARDSGQISTTDHLNPTGQPMLPPGYTPAPGLNDDPYSPKETGNRQNNELRDLRQTMQSEAREAERLGFDRRVPPQKAPFNSHGQDVFTDGKRFITRDVDSHNGGVWKMFDRAGNRIGTYDANLRYIGK